MANMIKSLTQTDNQIVSKIVEMDETYIGDSEVNKHTKIKIKNLVYG